ncbi:chemokine-like factor [Falco biarmicus]|uniref:chemokine-like factor n=1 Tax=Falco rusticolus TaxID=120794 RepID=UPI00188695AE|nr:chemokine-like factor [Falco rusticolus]XP_040471759.1 chemokine-like factor [Falco naumanni]XP_055582407.1 chemokine-like factor [Falco cherrug]XP_055674692.1 chemokine-like factor [Falco peregrinus]XP_056216529.1 chemokine-like factor [Falco biarmicus]
MAVAMDGAFPRSPRGALKLARALLAAVAFCCFVGSRSPGAYGALALAEAVIAALFFLLYWLRLDRRLGGLRWALADVFNSVVAALFLLVVCLFAVIIKSNNGTLAGGVFGLVLFVLCVVDAVVVFQKISLDGTRGRNTPAK